MGATVSDSKRERTKLSTTVAPETHEFLAQMVARGEAATVAEALDIVIDKCRRLENRRRLAEATARYFAEADPHATAEERELEHDLASVAGRIDFDTEI
jgi:hypothetical protein